MVCDSKQMAYRVASAGAKKMVDGGDRWERLDTWNWWVKSPSGGGYNVAIYESGEAHCGCPFFADNAEHGVCKHTQRLRWDLKAERDREEAQAEEDALAIEAQEFMEACRAEHLAGYGY